MAAPREIAELVERFERNLEDYRSGRYKETQLRLEFIDPFFDALGWDVHNRRGYAEAYKDVIHEDAIKVGGATKAPDYCFRIGGTRKFFVEAKKPSVSIKEAVHPAYQLRRYAWSAKLPLSILTDFEEFAAYDCRIKPAKTDKASAARTLYVPFTEYASRWDEIASIFSREEVLKGSFDKYAESTKRKKGTAEVDSAFLQEIEVWRESLARNIALRNPQLTQRELNFAVQRTIDRIIFLRICEDRGVEHYGQLQALLNGTNVYPRLCQLFYRADERYNSGLFYFRKEKARPDAPDELTPGLAIDDKALKEILARLYYPESPYEFSVLPADILGQVYEQFLGKVIRLTAGHRAVVEDKPEVRKAGGVYYTPTYIVDYIVKNTVGKLLAGEGSGARDQGSGYGVSGSGKGDCTYGAEDVSRPSGLAKGDGPGRSGLHDDGGLSGPGEVRTDQPDSEGGGLHSGQHRGGLRQDTPRGLSSSSLDRERLPDGGGDVSDVGGASEIRQPGACSRGLEPDGTGRQNADEAHRLSPASSNPHPGTLNPDSQPLHPIPQPLTPKEAAKLRILDPACGSGSFLIGAYQYLLDWHLNWYTTHNPEKWARKKPPPIYETRAPQTLNPKPHTPTPSYRLTTSERKRILLNNIYGVDIDPQAVEVTKLSLLLKVLEGENEETLERQLKFFHERALPDLGSNIKCGNSLIGPDFYDNQQIGMFDEEERYRINAFDWNAEFPEIIKSGGFDAVIGNPPWISLSGKFRAEVYSQAEIGYLLCRFRGNTYMPNMYEYFVAQGLTLTRDTGYLSFVVPDRLGFNSQFIPLRRRILVESQIISLLYEVPFPGITADTLIFVFQKGSSDGSRAVHVSEYGKPGTDQRQGEFLAHPTHAFQYFENTEIMRLIAKVDSLPGVTPIRNVCESTSGFGGKSELVAEARTTTKQIPTLKGDSIGRYEMRKHYWFDFRRENITGRTTDPRKLGASPKILLRKTGDRIVATYDDSGAFPEQSLYFLYNNRTGISFLFLLGVLNSRLLTAYYRAKSLTNIKTIAQVKKVDLERLPVPLPCLSVPQDKARHHRIVELVQRMLELHKKLAAAKTAHEKTVLQREIETTDRQIDQLVYELYGLTEEEIKIVEQQTGRP